MGVVSWIAVGALAALLVHARGNGRFPGGLAGTLAAGTAGGFLGGGSFSLAAQRATSGLDLTALLFAVVGSALIVAATRSAAYAEPRPR